MTAASLSAADFDAYFAEVHGTSPFPWQRRLAQQVCASAGWPAALDLPTGTGKTAVMDIAVFALALDAARAPADRRVPRRAILVVDRRTVVDQAYARARKISEKLSTADGDSVVGRVATALHSLRGDVSWPEKRPERKALEVAYLRGAIPRDDGWARDPSQPLLGVSTVDQVGSRLLFRGYGVSPGMRSVHAGLLANDVVYFLDEVHLSRPFAETLAAVAKWRHHAAVQVPAGFHVVSMSATRSPDGHDEVPEPFGLDDDDCAHATLRQRLSAPKPVELEVVKVTGDESRRRDGFAARLAALALASRSAHHRRIAVVVNRVDTALAVYDAIIGEVEEPETAVLVTGRMRPLDREDHERELRSVAAGVPRDPAAPAKFVVATQCIEAGADLDFDVLITECASLDALVQRFGRLDRLGEHRQARGVIAIRSDQTDDEDRVYGTSRSATWQYLSQRSSPIEFGLTGDVRVAAPAGVFPDPVHAPLMRPGDLDLWSQTSHEVWPLPAVDLWLHGPRSGSAEVSVIWRADVTRDGDAPGFLPREVLQGIFSASPPLRLEALSVPLWAARDWLAGRRSSGVADVEGEAAVAEEWSRERPPVRPVIRWRGGQDGIEIVDDPSATGPDGLRPGDTIVVPAAYGGIRAGTWASDSTTPVIDRGDEAQLRQRHRLAVRLGALSGSGSDGDDDAARVRSLAARLAAAMEGTSEDDEPAAIVAQLRAHLQSNGPPWLVEVLKAEFALTPLLIGAGEDADASPQQVVLTTRAKVKPVGTLGGDDQGMPEVSSDDDSASRTGVQVDLAAHLAHVEEQAAAFAGVRGVPVEIARDVVLAAAWHDVGKADPRFQLWLCEGDEVARAILSAPLAKSALPSNDRRRLRIARQRAQYPRGARHELASVAMLERADAVLARATDPDLVLHLVASHHGWCRPFAPVEDPGPEVAIEWAHDGQQLATSSAHGLASIGATVVDRFWSLTAKYGWWGLAWLETLVRLADHCASRTEQDQASKGGRP